jgi:acetolactate synthase I/II/III large subunit
MSDQENQQTDRPTINGPTTQAPTIEGHGGELAVAAARAAGVEVMFTLSGAHVFPMYDGAVKADPPMPLVDVRHEQTAVFAAEATAKLTRRPGLAVLTAGPGVTNGVSAVTSAHFNGVPLVVVGGRAPAYRWGSGALQELDHPPLLAPVTKSATTLTDVAGTVEAVSKAFALAIAPHRGPVFLDVPMDQLFSRATALAPVTAAVVPVAPDPDDIAEIATALSQAHHPVLVLGSDVWTDTADEAATRLARTLGMPVVTNGMGRGILAGTDPLLVTRARSRAFADADLVLVAGTPLDFRLGYGAFAGNDSGPAKVVHLADSPGQLATHVELAASACGDLSQVLDGIRTAWEQLLRRPWYADWATSLRADAESAVAKDQAILHSDADPIHPARVYGELLGRLEPDAVVIGDGGDFVSFAGRFVEPSRPGGWLDPGPYGCLGTGAGYAIAARLARPSAQVVLLMGDGAAGFSLMDVDTMVRHRLPVVMVVGNNGMWGLEKHPMQFLYGYDVAAELRQQTRYDDVVVALGGGGETVRSPAELGPALDRAMASGIPYLVNVLTDPAVAYPRSTTGV